MYPTLPFGPLSLPTGPVLAIFAVVLTLDVAGRYARRLGIHPDDLWNVGLIGLAAGLIVARLWNVFQFWPIYRAEPVLIFSIRPSGFEFWPGLAAAVVGGYLYLLYRALDPLRVAAALAVGLLAGGVLLSISGHATGAILGVLTAVPWALPYFGEPRHPVGLYRAAGLVLLCLVVWTTVDVRRAQRAPGRVVLVALLGYSLLRLFTDAYLQSEALIGSFRQSQVVALVVALAASLALARSKDVTPVQDTGPDGAPVVAQESPVHPDKPGPGDPGPADPSPAPAEDAP